MESDAGNDSPVQALHTDLSPGRKRFAMKLFEKMRQQKLMSMALMLFTLSVGILIGTLINTQVNAARDQNAAPDATPLMMSDALAMPRQKTLTSGFPAYDGSNTISPPTVGMPMLLP